MTKRSAKGSNNEEMSLKNYRERNIIERII